jgi:hypothetical protein
VTDSPICWTSNLLAEKCSQATFRPCFHRFLFCFCSASSGSKLGLNWIASEEFRCAYRLCLCFIQCEGFSCAGNWTVTHQDRLCLHIQVNWRNEVWVQMTLGLTGGEWEVCAIWVNHRPPKIAKAGFWSQFLSPL